MRAPVPTTAPFEIAPETFLIPNLAPGAPGAYVPVNTMVIRGAELDAIGLSHSRSAAMRAQVEGARRAVSQDDPVAACDHLVDFDAAAGRAVQRRWLTAGQVAGPLDTSRDAQLALRCPT